ncbi:MAG: hypothetical protein NVS9B15_04390 [Acidobacteriaceae bacterium]
MDIAIVESIDEVSPKKRAQCSNGGASVLDDCIVKIEEARGRRVLYQHPLYKPSTFEIRPLDDNDGSAPPLQRRPYKKRISN